MVFGFHFSSGQNYLFSNKESSISFEVSHLDILTVAGEFQRFEGSMKSINQEWRVSLVVNSASIKTNNDDRDKTIKGAQYLNVDKFPEMFFSGKAVRASKEYSVKGDLSICGNSKRIDFLLKVVGKHLEGSVEISRRDFKLDFGGMDMLIGDRIKIHAELFLISSRD